MSGGNILISYQNSVYNTWDTHVEGKSYERAIWGEGWGVVTHWGKTDWLVANLHPINE